MKTKLIILTILFLFIPAITLAHQPRLVTEPALTEIFNPEISQAFYGQLQGEAQYFKIQAPNPFVLYVGILVPQEENIGQDLIVDIYLNDEKIIILDGTDSTWQEFYEEFAGDYYFKGPEVRSDAQPGTYLISVSSLDNLGKYVLVVGEKESFPPKEIIQTIKILPQLKKDFFNKPAWTAFYNRIGLFLAIPVIALILVVILLVFVKRSLNTFFYFLKKLLKAIKKIFD